MKRFALAALALAALAVPASAQTYGGAPACAKDYKDFWDKISNSGPAKQLSADQYAKLSRMALRGYDACTSGDERFTANNFFKKLESVSPAKADEFFKDLEKSFPAKK
jgi:hypothetical protein